MIWTFIKEPYYRLYLMLRTTLPIDRFLIRSDLCVRLRCFLLLQTAWIETVYSLSNVCRISASNL
jgi:hypothetical protein